LPGSFAYFLSAASQACGVDLSVQIDGEAILTYTSNVYITKEIVMIRTQIYLTEEEKAQLEIIALTRGVKQSELIREAVDELIEKYTPSQRLTLIKQARGLWKNRQDLVALRDLRSGWSRRAQT